MRLVQVLARCRVCNSRRRVLFLSLAESLDGGERPRKEVIFAFPKNSEKATDSLNTALERAGRWSSPEILSPPQRASGPQGLILKLEICREDIEILRRAMIPNRRENTALHGKKNTSFRAVEDMKRTGTKSTTPFVYAFAQARFTDQSVRRLKPYPRTDSLCDYAPTYLICLCLSVSKCLSVL